MDLKTLHEQYGAACIQLEIWQNKVMELKRAIAEEMNKPKIIPAKEPKKNV